MQPKDRLFIVGAGSFGREMEAWLSLTPPDERDWELEGFLHSPSKAPVTGFPSSLEVLGDWKSFGFSPSDRIVLAISSFEWKERIWDHLHGKVQFMTYIAPSAIVANFSNVGEGSVIGPNCVVSTNVSIGRGVTVNTATGVGHDSKVGDFSSLMARVTVGGQVNLGVSSTVGSGSVILPGVSVGRQAIVGVGSVVIRDVSPGTTVFGNPAKQLWVSRDC